MKVWAYCAADWIKATAAAAGVRPVTSPPQSDESIGLTLNRATKADLVYLNLHGFAGQPHFYGQKNGVVGPTALTAESVGRHRWDDCVVFAEVCFSAAYGGNEVARAFIASGARTFIGSVTEAYGRVRPSLLDGEADRLFWLFRRTYAKLGDPAKALNLAKRYLRILSWPLDADDRATLEAFVLLETEK